MKKRFLGILLSFALMLTVMPVLGTIEVNAMDTDPVAVYYWYDGTNTTLHLSSSNLSNDYDQTTDKEHKWAAEMGIDPTPAQANATTVVFDNQISPNTTNDWFNSFKSLTTINNPENLDTSSVTKMDRMFLYCESLANLDASMWNTSSVTDMFAVFAECNKLTELDVSGWDTSNVSVMYSMFQNSNSLTTICVSENADWSSAAYTDGMFNGCTSLAGGAGTRYDPNHNNGEYARVDGGESNPGYFTVKPAPEPTPTPTPTPTPAPTPAPAPTASVTVNAKTVSASTLAAAYAKAGVNPDSVATVVLGKKVKKIKKGSFQNLRNANTLVVKSKKLTKARVKGSLKGSSITKVKVKVGKKKTNKYYAKRYKRIFTKKNCGKKVSVSR